MAQKIEVPHNRVDEILKNALALAKAKNTIIEQNTRLAREAELADREKWQPWGAHQVPPSDNDWLTWLLICR